MVAPAPVCWCCTTIRLPSQDGQRDRWRIDENKRHLCHGCVQRRARLLTILQAENQRKARRRMNGRRP